MKIARSALVFAGVLLSGSAAMAEVLPVSPPPAPQAPPEAAPLASGPTAVAPPLAGWNGTFFIRDPMDYFRIYPKMRIQMDLHNSFGPGVHDVKAANGGNAFQSKIFLRRMVFEFGGEFLKRWTFYGSLTVNQAINNIDGRAELSAAGPGQNPTADTARFQPDQTAAFTAAPDDFYINFMVTPWLQIMAGHYLTPFSMDNRTGNKFTSFMERTMGIRSFALQAPQEIGVTVWGEAFGKKLSYEVGVFGGEGVNRPQLDDRLDWSGRVFAKPLLDCKCAFTNAQIGLSARHGERNQEFIGYDYAPVTSNQGATLWNPAYRESFGRSIHVVPSGAQNAIGGELRLPVSRFELRSEAYYVANNTREVVDGFQLTNTERLGQVRGVGWYAQVSGWPLGDTFVNGEPGVYRPTRIDFSKEAPPPKRGIEAMAVVGGVNGAYDGGSRKGGYDVNTPGSPSGKVAKAIAVYEFGLGLNYWHSSYIRTSANYFAYFTPGSGSVDNLAAVPGNSVADVATKESAHVLHELSFRVAVGF